MDPGEQVLARGRHPGEHRLHQVRQRPAHPILRLRSRRFRGSLRHGRLLGPGRGDRLSWSTRFSRRPGSRRYSVLKFNKDPDIPFRGVLFVNLVKLAYWVELTGTLMTHGGDSE